MYKKLFVFFVVFMNCIAVKAEVLSLDDALRETYTYCVGIDDALYDMKVKAGINTAITGVGTGLGIGATAAGIAKTETDKLLDQKYQQLIEISYEYKGEDPSEEQKQQWLKAFNESLQNETWGQNADSEQNQTSQEIQRLTQKSKSLGNWRTGLLAGTTATNIAGAAIAGTNKVNQTLEEQIKNCVASVKKLRDSIIQAKFNNEDITEANEIELACRDFEYINIEKINNRATGSMVSSIVGGTTGVVGTITSAVANSNNIRNDDTEQGKQKEKALNTTSNVLAAGSTVATATATVFNAIQIKAIKEASEIAEKCTGALR